MAVPVPSFDQALTVANTGFSQAGNADPTIKAGYIAGQVAATVIGTISTITDNSKRQTFLNAFNNMSLSEQAQLADKLNQTRDNLSKLQILSSAIVASKLNVTANSATNYNRVVLISISAIFVIIIIHAVYIRNKK